MNNVCAGDATAACQTIAGDSSTLSHLVRKMAADPPVPPKTFLPQKSMIFVNMTKYHIVAFVVAFFAVNFALVKFQFGPPVGGSLEEKFSMENPTFRTFLLTSAIILVKLGMMAMFAVYMAAKNNSFSKNPEDFNTGHLAVAPSKRESDPEQDRAQRIHLNCLENYPLAVLSHLIMVAVGPDPTAANIFMWTFVIARFLWTLWYWNAGSHEIRATLYSTGLFCNIGCCFQVLKALGHI